MRRRTLLSLAALVLMPAVVHAQVAIGLGGGTGVGSRGGGSGGGHANASLELKLPVLPGVRGDAYFMDVPNSSASTALVVSAVVSAPTPAVTPYLIGGWGTYGIGGSSTLTGWNLGAGVRASVMLGPSFFLEVRRHERFARDIVTLGLRF